MADAMTVLPSPNVEPVASSSGASATRLPEPSCFALIGNPNTGKTTLFNRLCGLRAKTANFPGSTIEARIGRLRPARSRQAAQATPTIVDLPGLYALHCQASTAPPEACVCLDHLEGRAELPGVKPPDAMLIVADATNLVRNLQIVAHALSRGLPAVIALNMIDLAQRRGLTIDAEALSGHLGCPVVPICARTGEGVPELVEAMRTPQVSNAALPDPADRNATVRWAEEVFARSAGGTDAAVHEDTFTDRLDTAFTHPILGLFVFAGVMIGLFYTIFTLASVPMDLIELLFARLGGALHWGFVALRDAAGIDLVEGALHNLLIDGIVGGVAATVVFLPQICLLFFLLSLLEDTGYLARASFVVDRALRRFGLPGQAFVPVLSAHACAIPAIMSTRLIPDQRDRLAAILVLPFFSCSARLPVYVLLIGVLFADAPLMAGLAFVGCYALGAAAALLTALLFRRTLLKGVSRPMVLELPSYKTPSLRTALYTTYDRGMMFLRRAGTVILAICIVLWWLSAYPVSGEPDEAAALRSEAALVEEAQPATAAELVARADHLAARAQLSGSFAGRLGRAIEPVFEPLGYDWQLSIGVVSSFAAREVFVSTLSVLFAGTDEAEEPAVRERIVTARRSDGSPLLTKSTALSLLVFYVLAMQCLPTLAVTRRETGSWKWAVLQLLYMSCVAYVAALLARTAALWMGAT